MNSEPPVWKKRTPASPAVALASSGGIDRRVRLPAVERVIGGTHLAHRGEPAREELDLPIQELYAVTAEMNLRGYRATEY